MKAFIKHATTISMLSSMCAFGLAGCSTMEAATEKPSNDSVTTIDKIKDLVGARGENSELEALKAQLAKQQEQLAEMNAQQQALQEKMKQQQVLLKLNPTASANAGRTKVGTASTAYIAFLEEKEQFSELESLAQKEMVLIPKRPSEQTLAIPRDAKFIAVKVGLRYTKKRSQFLIPLDSLDFDTPLEINVGACDVNIVSGIQPNKNTTFEQKLNDYQQPLVRCS
ncbi:hypothetical protein [Psychrobacter aestuarii]|uniref:Uncharacterized protein n=1 Tax=Psychrobacter aestuarii TaxID=556327 RepID=A0ABP3FE28_9GAMM|nr:hypothetical protein [Psychrobacter aestuarii]